MIGDSNNDTNLPHKLLLTDRKVLKHHKAFANNSLANIKLSKTQLSEISIIRRTSWETSVTISKI